VEVPVRQAAKDKGGFGGRTKKKLRLSKEQYGFLEDSFKEHSTLTPVGVLIISSHVCQKEITCPVVFLEKNPDMLRFKYRIFLKK
jgi:homeobox-leucine zipper protein